MRKITVKNISKSQRGVFAAKNFKKGEVIETCPVIVMPLKEKKLMDRTHLYNYYFNWGWKNQPAIVLGTGSLYNHSYEPNAEYDQNLKKRVMVFKALRNIKKGEEIRTNYNGEPDDDSPLWFRVRKTAK